MGHESSDDCRLPLKAAKLLRVLCGNDNPVGYRKTIMLNLDSDVELEELQLDLDLTHPTCTWLLSPMSCCQRVDLARRFSWLDQYLSLLELKIHLTPT